MNHRRLRLSVTAAILLAAAAGCQRDPGPPPLAGATIGGPFTLTDQDGRRVSEAAFSGRYRLLYFGFTNCPDVCPVDLQVVGAGLRAFEARAPERAARVQPIFVSVDPARDTPAVLKRYVLNFHPRLIGLTGTPAEIASVKRAYGVFGERGVDTGGGGYNVDHSRILLLMGPRGEPIAIVPHDEGPDGVAEVLDQWVR